MPKPCLCKYVPEILERLEALEKQQDGCCCCKQECRDEFQEREQQLDEFEATLAAGEKANEDKLKELERVSNQIHALKQQMADVQAEDQGTQEERDEYEANQKALETYATTWQLTNQMFSKMYN